MFSNGIAHAECEPVEPLPSDLLLIIRDGMPILRTPVNEGGRVEDEFMMALAICASWLDPGFRSMMLEAAKNAADQGAFEGIIHAGASH